jgi:peptidoglycan/LPS O-acetylase OafA/YrhL
MERDAGYARIDAIDALRGLAASSVVLQHIYGIPKIPTDNWIRWLVGEGLGVPLFFAVSAFCLYYAIEKHEGGGASASSFYMRRFFRIAPLYYAMLLFYILFLGVTNKPDFTETLLLCLVFIYNFFEGTQQPGLVWASWTISIEMMFYAMFPLIYAHVRSLWRAAALLLSFVLLAEAFLQVLPYLAKNPPTYYSLSFFRFLPFFAAGIIGYQLLLKLGTHRHAPLIGGLFLAASLALIAGHRADIFYPYRDHPVALACGLAVVGIVLCPIRLLVNRATKFLGQISYSLYLAHPPIIYYSNKIYSAIYALPIPAPLCFAVSAVVTFAMAVPVAWLLFTFVERPGNALGRRLAAKVASWRSRGTQPVASAA